MLNDKKKKHSHLTVRRTQNLLNYHNLLSFGIFQSKQIRFYHFIQSVSSLSLDSFAQHQVSNQVWETNAKCREGSLPNILIFLSFLCDRLWSCLWQFQTLQKWCDWTSCKNGSVDLQALSLPQWTSYSCSYPPMFPAPLCRLSHK